MYNVADLNILQSDYENALADLLRQVKTHTANGDTDLADMARDTYHCYERKLAHVNTQLGLPN